MRTEMHHGIGSKAVAKPQILGYIGIRRCGIRSVYHCKLVRAAAGSHLGHEHDIAELHAGQGETAVIRAKIFSGESSVQSAGFLRHARSKALRTPGLKLGSTDFQGIAILDKLSYRPVGISTEHGSLGHYQVLELLFA